MKALMEEAARLGVRVHLAHLDPDLHGFYSHRKRAIYINITRTPHERVETLAHELGHAYNGDECSDEGNEYAADRRAALLLVDPDAYEAAERTNDIPAAIADYLGVSEHIVTVWRDWWLPMILERRNRYA